MGNQEPFSLEELLARMRARLRRKIERPGRPVLIHTVRGVGFMLKEGAPRD